LLLAGQVVCNRCSLVDVLARTCCRFLDACLPALLHASLPAGLPACLPKCLPAQTPACPPGSLLACSPSCLRARQPSLPGDLCPRRLRRRALPPSEPAEVDVQCVMNMLRGPWHSDANFRKVAEARSGPNAHGHEVFVPAASSRAGGLCAQWPQSSSAGRGPGSLCESGSEAANVPRRRRSSSATSVRTARCTGSSTWGTQQQSRTARRRGGH
jgi:hypothetical protein